MAKFVVAGRADCPSYARAEILADTLAARLPDFCVHKVSIPGLHVLHVHMVLL